MDAACAALIREKEITMGSKILIYGAGAIGSIFAGKLAKYGNDVTVLKLLRKSKNDKQQF